MSRRISQITLLAILFIGLVSFLLAEKEKTAYWKHRTPPGTVKIKDNFYYDKTEAFNQDWRFYMFWTKKTFGEHSAEYLAALPDTTVWSKSDTCFSSLGSNYFNGVAYDYHPVLGISQKQAIAFSKWRSDRVFEKLLIDKQQFEYDANQNAETYFSIEKYFAGKYQNVKPDARLLYYPNYRLPTIEEYKAVIHLKDSLNKQTPWSIQAPIKPCNKSDFPTFGAPPKNNSLVYLLENVSEWAAEEGISLGGSWADRNRIGRQDTFHTLGVNAWTGFRNVCEWKKYEGPLK